MSPEKQPTQDDDRPSQATSDSTATVSEEASLAPVKRARRARQLSLGARLLVFGGGTVLLLIGIAGLALPGIQGVLTIALGAALISVGSPAVYRLLKRGLKRWPKLWKLVESFRNKVLDRFGD